MTNIAPPNVVAAAAYAAKHTLEALLVAAGDTVLHEEYGAGFDSNAAHALYSGTKSFWGITALCACEDGLFDLDEPVVSHVPEFKSDIRRAITPRMLLTMTAGYGFGGLGSAVPAYDKALEIQLKNPPGELFTYGGIPLQVFGAYFARVLRNETPHDYLRRRVLEPASTEIASWRTLKDGTAPLPTGASLRAHAWLSYGRYVLRERQRYHAAFVPTPVNARYGLCWWRAPAGIDRELFYASGSGGQALYVVPSLDLVVVHFSKSTSYKHETFLKRLLV